MPLAHNSHHLFMLCYHRCRPELAAFNESVVMHSGVPRAVEDVIHAMPHDAHPMAIILTGLCALSGCHPEQNPALAGQNVYKSREVQDQQIARLIGKVCYFVYVTYRYMPLHAVFGFCAYDLAARLLLLLVVQA
jgi:citrate synthase